MTLPSWLSPPPSPHLAVAAFGYTVRPIPRNELLTSVAELGVVAVA
jgi:hypothetical protein